MTISTLYAAPGHTFEDQPWFKWVDEYKFILRTPKAAAGPYAQFNEINSWLSSHDERRAELRTPLKSDLTFILVSIKSEKTAMLFKLTFGGAA